MGSVANKYVEDWSRWCERTRTQRRVTKKSGSCRKTFEYEDQLDELFAKDPTIQPEYTLSSNPTTVSKRSASVNWFLYLRHTWLSKTKDRKTWTNAYRTHANNEQIYL